MGSRIRNPFRDVPRHRAPSKTRTDSQPIHFAPKHCAGQDGGSGFDGCMHRHPGERLLPVWGSVG